MFVCFLNWAHRTSPLYSPVPGKFLGIVVGQDPSDSKSNWLHVDIVRFCCFHSFEVYSIDFSKMIGKFPEVLNFQPVMSRTQPVRLQLTASSYRSYRTWVFTIKCGTINKIWRRSLVSFKTCVFMVFVLWSFRTTRQPSNIRLYRLTKSNQITPATP